MSRVRVSRVRARARVSRARVVTLLGSLSVSEDSRSPWLMIEPGCFSCEIVPASVAW